jgi:hypothetical protein
MTLAIERGYTTGAIILMIIFFLIAANLILGSIYGYNFSFTIDYNRSQIITFIVGLVSISIASIPFMYESPPIPTLVRSGNNITVTNYNSLGNNPNLVLYSLGVDNYPIEYKSITFNKTTNSWYNPDGFTINSSYVVRNLRGGLVYSQSASI